jgi:indolepyruvate ferredoxin oxidoreductase beta subunit
MSEKRVSMLLVGVGGQGLLTTARILGDAAHAARQQVVVGQLHGMSQRGGSVECSILFGPGKSSYLSRADIVVGFEPLETLRALPRMGPETRVLINTGKFVLPTLIRDKKPYPPLNEILSDIRSVTNNVVVVDGAGALKKVGNVRTINIYMLGALVSHGFLPFNEEILWTMVEHRCGPGLLEANRMAFMLGCSSIQNSNSESIDEKVPNEGFYRE